MTNEIPDIITVNRALILNQKQILLVQRALNDSYRPGEWELPGGKVDPNESQIDGLIREVREETGLFIEPFSTPVYREDTEITQGKYAGKLHRALFYRVRILEGTLTLSNEHAAAIWDIPTRAVNQTGLTPDTRRAIIALTR